MLRRSVGSYWPVVNVVELVVVVAGLAAHLTAQVAVPDLGKRASTTGHDRSSS
jgi:hypothetical protein